ncbi:peptidase [Halomonas eurihalina]|uniref:Peptidase n=1 Tax=Halomonas eurihalina TaxID=42566 RepID=A0A5D9DC73_HALER|nr:imelysin family protein [Halomonas eurihalina]MDR5858527.1 imelysin family protein [Halomonas eurihalina]TZG40720.1 peptidase [Halomonas eurihalina]
MPTCFAPRPLPCIIVLATLFPVTAMATDGKTTAEQVVGHYADLAHANYQDALVAARTLDERIDALLADPNNETLAAARQAWVEARVPYQQSEVFRFGNAVVDDWEGQLNAWPLDEGMIDYVASDDYQHELGNAGATANIIANQSIQVGGETVDVSELTPDLLADLNEIGGSEANVASGYHAIEFLLWGQDRHGFEAGNGERPASDYMSGEACTHGHCDRRGAYLDAASDLLVSDLEWMVAQWAPDSDDNYRQALLAESPEEGLRRMLFGMGSLSLGELAGERMKVALEANSVEDEHDCFSDNTHNSHYYNGQGIQNVYTGRYQRLDGSTLEGPSLSDLVATRDSALDDTLKAQLASSMDELEALKQAAEAEQDPMAFDMMIAPGNEQGTELVNNAILALVTQTGSIEKAADELGVNSLQSDDAGHTF